MKYEAEVRGLLIENAIHLIAKGGFEMATTKELTHCRGSLPNFKMNEVYIYRLFGSKENLYRATFACLDRELFSALYDSMKHMDSLESNLRATMYDVFLRLWSFLLGNEERCRCYIRYYYSIYFKDESAEEHKKLFGEFITKITPIFKEEAEVFAIMHSVFVMLFDFAIRVYNGDIEDNDINRPHVFNVLYCMMMTYFKDTVQAN